MQRVNRLVVGISGASGAAIAIELLKQMQPRAGWETHLVISRGARRTIEMETAYSLKEVETMATQCYAIEDVGASIASGTFKCAGMVVAPCSMKTVSGIAHGFSENLLLRAADVTIKERRRLILVARESPLSPIHLSNLLQMCIRDRSFSLAIWNSRSASRCSPVLSISSSRIWRWRVRRTPRSFNDPSIDSPGIDKLFNFNRGKPVAVTY